MLITVKEVTQQSSQCSIVLLPLRRKDRHLRWSVPFMHSLCPRHSVHINFVTSHSDLASKIFRRNWSSAGRDCSRLYSQEVLKLPLNADLIAEAPFLLPLKQPTFRALSCTREPAVCNINTFSVLLFHAWHSSFCMTFLGISSHVRDASS